MRFCRFRYRSDRLPGYWLWSPASFVAGNLHKAKLRNRQHSMLGPISPHKALHSLYQLPFIVRKLHIYGVGHIDRWTYWSSSRHRRKQRYKSVSNNQEQNAFGNQPGAAEEIARQLKLRDLVGSCGWLIRYEASGHKRKLVEAMEGFMRMIGPSMLCAYFEVWPYAVLPGNEWKAGDHNQYPGSLSDL